MGRPAAVTKRRAVSFPCLNVRFLPDATGLYLVIDFEKGRTGHGFSDLSYYGLFWPSLLQ
jgi:hypothetical protein